MTKQFRASAISRGIGDRVAWIRSEMLDNVTQSDVAAAMRRYGFRWTRSVVASVEGGSREVTIPEVIGLALCLSTSLRFLVAEDEDVNVPISDTMQMNSRVLRGFFSNAGLKEHLIERVPGPQIRIRSGRYDLNEAREFARSDLEMRIAKRLGLDPLVVAILGRRRFGMYPTTKRRRVSEAEDISLAHASRRVIATIEETVSQDPALVKEIEAALRKEQTK